MVWQQHDIEDRKQAEEKLRRDEIELRQITDMPYLKHIVVMEPRMEPVFTRIGLFTKYTGIKAGRPQLRTAFTLKRYIRTTWNG